MEIAIERPALKVKEPYLETKVQRRNKRRVQIGEKAMVTFFVIAFILVVFALFLSVTGIGSPLTESVLSGAGVSTLAGLLLMIKEVKKRNEELKTDIKELKGDLKTDIGELKSDIKDDIKEVSSDIKSVNGSVLMLTGEFNRLQGEHRTNHPI